MPTPDKHAESMLKLMKYFIRERSAQAYTTPDIEVAAAAAGGGAREQHSDGKGSAAAAYKKMGWAKIILGCSLTSSIELAILSAQAEYLQTHPIFNFLSFSILFSFSFLLLSKAIVSKLPMVAEIFEGAAIFCAVTTFFTAISIPLPLPLKITVWVLYAAVLLFIILFNLILYLLY